MRSPTHPNVFLTRVTLEPGLDVLRCPEDGGVWIEFKSYQRWLEAVKDTLSEADNAASQTAPVADSPAGKRCPEDGYFLIRHRVGHGVGFHADRCGHCGGVWLDAGEWEALREHGLAQSLHLVFTDAWQAAVRREQRAALAEQRMTRWFGESDFAEARRIRAWIDRHPRAYELRAYLDGEYDE